MESIKKRILEIVNEDPDRVPGVPSWMNPEIIRKRTENQRRERVESAFRGRVKNLAHLHKTAIGVNPDHIVPPDEFLSIMAHAGNETRAPSIAMSRRIEQAFRNRRETESPEMKLLRWGKYGMGSQGDINTAGKALRRGFERATSPEEHGRRIKRAFIRRQ